MTEHYNAFISYRHTPKDSKVAQEIQKQLERFKIPKAIQKSTKIKKIDRIFRDKEELPITSNLNETIEHALNHSDFLIIVCSHEMLESIWVKREIDFFLKTHTKKQILTVIADGEPVDVLPEILKTDEIQVTMDDGTSEIVSIPAEPLSCDYRLPFNKARKEELPRLAAALIGCSYDGLRQRQRQYKRRRTIAAGTAAGIALTSLAGYFAWSAAKINENYIASLKNQSAYLSSESNRLYDNGDRLSAMMLALEALPSEGNDRPVIPEAVDAIVRSTYAYQYPGSNLRTLDTSYTHKGEVDSFGFDSTNRYMFVQHSRYSLSFWDTQNHVEYFTKTYENALDTPIVTSDDNLLVWNWDMIECLDGQTGSVIWSYDDMVTNAVIHEGTNRAAVAHYNIGKENSDEVQILDLTNGNVLHAMPHEMTIDDITWALTPLCFNPQGNILAIKMYEDLDKPLQIGFWNLDDNTFVYFPTDTINIENAVFADNHSFILITPAGGTNTLDGYSYIHKMKGQNYHIMGYTSMILRCFDTSANLLWSAEHPYSLLYSGSFCDSITYTQEEASIPAFLFSTGNRSGVYHMATGELLNSITTSDSITGYIYADEVATYYLKNGKSGAWDLNNLYTEIDSTISNVGIAYYSDRLYVSASDSNQILSYQKKLYDQNWETVTTLPFSDNTYHTADGTLIISDTSTKGQKSLIVTYLTSNGIKWQKELDRNYYYYTYIGSNDDYIALLYQGYDEDYNSYHYYEYWNLETGEVTTKDPYTALNDPVISVITGNNQYIYMNCETDDNNERLANYIITDLDFNVISKLTISPDEQSFSIKSSNKTGTALLLSSYETLYSLTEQGCFPLCTTDDYTIIHAWNESDNDIALALNNNIQVYNKRGQLEYEIPCDGRSPISIEFYENNLLIAYENGVLRRYSAADGTYLSETEIQMGSLPTLNEIIWEFSEDELWLIIDEELNIIDTATWKPETAVSNCFDFDIDKQVLFLIGWEDGMNETEEKCIGKFNRYTVNELIERAKEQLGSVELTEEQKAQYGIT